LGRLTVENGLAEARLDGVFAAARVVATQPIQKLNYSHEAMIGLIIANPGISQNHLAQVFGYSPSWISRVMASDAFQSRLAEKTKELVDPSIRTTVEDRIKGLMLRSYEILEAKLDKDPSSVPDNLVLRTAELSQRALGYGAQRDVPPPTVSNMEKHLETLAGGLTTLLKQKRREAREDARGDATDAEVIPAAAQ
jgi:hypothetical protein